MQRMDRYREVVKEMQDKGLIYPCYMSVAELDALRERQMAAKEKPRYDGTWRPEPGKTLPAIPPGVQPVWRFKNPIGGVVAWDDKVKGRIEISNDELDDLVIARPDGTPTYNFCVVVDDIDMEITHVIRGDDHVNNTPRQINIFRALGYEPPVFAPPAHRAERAGREDEQAQRRQARHAVPRRRLPGRRGGELPGAPGLVARRRRDLQPRAVPELVQPGPPGQERGAVRRRQAALGEQPAHEGDGRHGAGACWSIPAAQARHHAGCAAAGICGLVKDRCDTLLVLADWAERFYGDVQPNADEAAKHITDGVRPAISMLAKMLEGNEWTKEAISEAIKDVLRATGLKMPQLAMPVRVLVMGTAQTPSLDAVLAASREIVVERLRRA
jgi:glutamyl-tRNA synthetase